MIHRHAWGVLNPNNHGVNQLHQLLESFIYLRSSQINPRVVELSKGEV